MILRALVLLLLVQNEEKYLRLWNAITVCLAYHTQVYIRDKKCRSVFNCVAGLFTQALRVRYFESHKRRRMTKPSFKWEKEQLQMHLKGLTKIRSNDLRQLMSRSTDTTTNKAIFGSITSLSTEAHCAPNEKEKKEDGSKIILFTYSTILSYSHRSDYFYVAVSKA